MNPMHSRAEKAAASAVASLSTKTWKRDAHVVSDTDEETRPSKTARIEGPSTEANLQNHAVQQNKGINGRTLQPYPFFYYKDFSTEPDDDSLAPLTPPGRVPNFPAKMHAILSRPELADIVAWMPHGRAWRILKPREFELRVIPTYFEHSKFSSFIRQANGWGFRRITQGRDRNAYYHELFLRGLPHLCKKMKRPGVSQKTAVDPDHEPDLYRISDLHAIPEKADDEETILLQCTLQGGPKARMPVYAGNFRFQGDPPSLSRDKFASFPFKRQVALQDPVHPLSQPRFGSASPSMHLDCLSTAEHLALAMQPSIPSATATASAASQFAAGFAAASAINSDRVRNVLGQVLVASNQPMTASNRRFSGHSYHSALLG